MYGKKFKLVIETSVWISFLFGGSTRKMLLEILNSDRCIIYICKELLEEIKNTIQEPQIQKYISKTDINNLYTVLKERLIEKPLSSSVKVCRDANDDFLCAFSKDVFANYLLTFDKDLLILEKYKKTEIISINQFTKILRSS